MFQEEDSRLAEGEKSECVEERLFSSEGGLGFFEEDLLPSDEDVKSKPDSVVSAGSSELLRCDVNTPMGFKKWSEEKGQWTLGESQLSTYTCWKCSNVGHLAKDCTVAVTSHGQSTNSAGARPRIPRTLQALYATCREVGNRKGQRCADCGVRSNLACCLDCRWVFATSEWGGVKVQAM